MIKTIGKILIIIVLASCSRNNGNCPIPLERFDVKDSTLKECLSVILSDVKPDVKKNVLCVGLDMVDTMKFYNITIEDKSCLSDYHLMWQNKRIVGYSYYDDQLIILSSNVNNHFNFLDYFSRDIELTDEVRTFDFVYYPSNRYKFDDDLKSWKNKVHLYEPLTFVCWQDSLKNVLFVFTNAPYNYMYHLDSLKSASHSIRLLKKQ